MTTPTPYDTPGRGPWRRRKESTPPAQSARRVSSPGHLHPGLARTASVGVAATEVTSMLLPLEGAAGTKITIYNLDKARADLTIDGESVKRESNGDFKIPMASGGPEKLEVRSTFPGYPTIKFKGKTLYKAPKPPAVYSAAYVAMIVGATVLGASLGGIATAGAMTMGAGYVAPSLMLKARQKGIPLVWILLVGAGLGALGVAHFMASGMTR